MSEPNIHLTNPMLLGSLQFGGSLNQPVVTIHPDGRVEVNPAYTVDDAARAFWDAVIKLNPIWQKPEGA